MDLALNRVLNRETSLGKYKGSLEYWQWSLLPDKRKTADETFCVRSCDGMSNGGWNRVFMAYKAHVRADLGWPASISWQQPEQFAGRSRYTWAVASR